MKLNSKRPKQRASHSVSIVPLLPKCPTFHNSIHHGNHATDHRGDLTPEGKSPSKAIALRVLTPVGPTRLHMQILWNPLQLRKRRPSGPAQLLATYLGA